MCAVLRSSCALLASLAFHAALAALIAAVFAGSDATLPELDVTSVDLSFSESPDETAAPASAQSAHEALPPERRIEPRRSEPPPLDLPPDASFAAPRPPEPESPNPAPPELTPPEQPERNVPDDVPIPAAPPTAQIAPSQAKIDAEKPPVPRRTIKPEYPKGARQRNEEGDVTLILHIAETGVVDDVAVDASCGYPELDNAAVAAARKARFTPARKDGKAVPGSARITLRFRLSKH